MVNISRAIKILIGLSGVSVISFLFGYLIPGTVFAVLALLFVKVIVTDEEQEQ
jgi:hypothetical protein